MTCTTGETSVQRGNTVRLQAMFKDFGGDPIDPATVKVILYDRRWTKIHEQTLGAPNKLDTGQYFYDYVPAAVGTLYYEWNGTIEGQPSLHRSALMVRDI